METAKWILNTSSAAIISSLVVSIFGYFISPRFRRGIKRLLSHFLNSGIVCVYKGQADAKSAIIKGANLSTEIRILTVRGMSFIEGELSELLTNSKASTTKFLFGNPDVASSGEYDYIAARSREIEVINNAPGRSEQFLTEIRTEIGRILIEPNIHGNIQVRLHNTPIAFRCIIFDHEMYLSFYSTTKRAVDDPIYCCKSTSELYRSFRRYFDLVWEAAVIKR